MKALVTGSSGFVGGAIFRGLCTLGYTLSGWDRRPSLQTTRIVDLASDPLQRLLCDIAPDIIVHAAGPASVGASFLNPYEDFEGSVIPWHRLLSAVRETNISTTVFLTSSAAVFGEPKDVTIHESSPYAPISPYGYHKYYCELLAQEYSELFGINIATTRLFSTYGPNQKRLLVWELFEQAFSTSCCIELQGTGHELRDYLFETDLAKLIDLVFRTSPRGFTKWNFATGRSVTTHELAELVSQIVGKPKSVSCLGLHRRGEPRRWFAPSPKVAQILMNQTPLLSLESGLVRCNEAWNRTNREVDR